MQASQSWNIRFDELIKAYSFIQTCDKVYVNDILLIGNNVEFSGKHKGVF